MFVPLHSSKPMMPPLGTTGKFRGAKMFVVDRQEREGMVLARKNAKSGLGIVLDRNIR